MPETVSVLAAPGRKVPREENPRRYYSAEQAETLPRTPYIDRLLLTGDLMLAKGGKRKEQ